MKKVLIASTALVAATMVSAGAASASEKIKLNLGGFSKWWVVGAFNEDGYNRDLSKASAAAGASGTTQNPAEVDIKGDNEIYFGGSTTLDNGLQVGIDVQLEAGGHTDAKQNAGATTTDVIDESYVWLAGGFGKVIVGSKNNGTYLIHNTAPDAAGNWNEGGIMTGGNAIARPNGITTNGIANNAAGAVIATVDQMGQIATDAGGNTAGTGSTTAILTDGDSEGITYVSPTFYGFTFGASYKGNGLSEDNRGVEGNAMPVYGAGLLYANTFGGVGIKADVGYAQYNPRGAAAGAGAGGPGTIEHGLQREYSAGLNLSYAGFTLGGSYRQIVDNKSGLRNAGALNNFDSVNNKDYDGKAWDLGLMYASGPYAVSFAYFNSKTEGLVADVDQDKIEAYQLSGKYNLGAGVDVLASAGYIKYEDELKGNTAAGATGQPALGAAANFQDAYENKGWVVMTGLSLAF